jgi:hypothetical protein
VTVFNFANLDTDTCRKISQRFPQMNHSFIDEKGSREFYQGQNRYITIVYTGPVPHQDFLRFMQEAEIPILVTGDVSLSEAISMGTCYLYHTPPWKHSVSYYISDLASALLPLDEAWIISQLFSLEQKEDAVSELFHESKYTEALGNFNHYMQELMDLPHNVALLIKKGLEMVGSS